MIVDFSALVDMIYVILCLVALVPVLVLGLVLWVNR